MIDISNFSVGDNIVCLNNDFRLEGILTFDSERRLCIAVSKVNQYESVFKGKLIPCDEVVAEHVYSLKEYEYTVNDDCICSDSEKMTAEKIKYLFHNDYDKLYNECRKYYKFVEDNAGDVPLDWDEQAEKKDDLYCRIANVLIWFDIDSIARLIYRNNIAVKETTDDKNELITSSFDNSYDYDVIRKGLYNDVKGCLESLVKYGEATELEPIKTYQRGRIHLNSFRYSYDIEKEKQSEYYDENADYSPYVALKIYWAFDDWETE